MPLTSQDDSAHDCSSPVMMGLAQMHVVLVAEQDCHFVSFPQHDRGRGAGRCNQVEKPNRSRGNETKKDEEGDPSPLEGDKYCGSRPQSEEERLMTDRTSCLTGDAALYTSR